METFAYFENTKRQIRKVVEYANNNIYQIDDILDMMNGELSAPGNMPEHLVDVPIGRWICYYIVDHPVHGRSHLFLLKPDASGRLPNKTDMEYMLKEFGIENPLLDKHITIDKINSEIKIILPFD